MPGEGTDKLLMGGRLHVSRKVTDRTPLMSVESVHTIYYNELTERTRVYH